MWLRRSIRLAFGLAVGSIAWLWRLLAGRDGVVTLAEYARTNGLDLRIVVAAQTEGRLDPPAYFRDPGSWPVTWSDYGERYVVERRAVIHPPKVL
jgi:hypothetical protein